MSIRGMDQLGGQVDQGINSLFSPFGLSQANFSRLHVAIYQFFTVPANDRPIPQAVEDSDVDKSTARSVCRSRKYRAITGASCQFEVHTLYSCFARQYLYNKTKAFLQGYLGPKALYNRRDRPSIEAKKEEMFEFIAEEWDYFVKRARTLNSLLNYINADTRFIRPINGPVEQLRRVQGQGQRDDADAGDVGADLRVRDSSYHVQCSVYQMCMDLWRESFLGDVRALALNEVALKKIKEDREDELRDPELQRPRIRSFLNFLAEIGYEDVPVETQEMGCISNLDRKYRFYRAYFEEDYLNRTAEYCQTQVTKYLAEGTTNYVSRVEKTLNEETERAKSVLEPITIPRLIKMIAELFVEKQMGAILEEFTARLKGDNLEGCVGLNRLLHYAQISDESFQGVAATFSEVIRAKGCEILEAQGNRARDPVVYCKVLRDIYDKYAKQLIDIFESKFMFKVAFEKGFATLVNTNSVSVTGRKSAEMLARYCNILLKKTGKVASDDELSASLDSTLNSFQFLHEKDLFQEYCSSFLANRLVTDASSGEVGEFLMINKLSNMMGWEYVFRLKRIHNDVSMSKSLTEQYNHSRESDPLPFKFQIHILHDGAWPFLQSQEDTLRIVTYPNEITGSMEHFSGFYTKKTSGRKLKWLHSRATVDLGTYGYNKPYTFSVSMVQMSVLMMFNTKDTYTLNEIVEGTKLNLADSEQVVDTLVKAKVLSMDEKPDSEPAAGGADAEDGNDSIIDRGLRTASLNKSYNGKKVKVNLSVPLRSQAKEDDKQIEVKTDKNRKNIIQACITRIMKGRKKLNEQELIAETTKELTKQFPPSVEMIKTGIKDLIEKDYLERNLEDPKTINYKT